MPRDKASGRSSSTAVAVVGMAIGVVYLVLGIVRHQLTSGVIGLVVMLAYVGLLYGLRRRSEPAQLLSANPTDERQAAVMLRATAFTGRLLVLVIVVGMLISIAAASQYTAVFSLLSAVGGGAFILSTVWYSRHA